MPILETNKDEKNYTHVGCVIEIKKRTENRNMSDTLDYSDYQHVECTYALVYLGRKGSEYDYVLGANRTYDLAIGERFKWIDISNHFAWRGMPVRTATVDVDAFEDETLSEDYSSWVGHNYGVQFRYAEDLAAKKVEHDRFEALRIHNLPALGKKMIVISGRKVKPGHTGTVAYVRDDRVLLKGDNEWKDRKANGVWVNARHLENRIPMK